LSIYNGELVVGGSFSTAGGVSASNIARWNGSAWQPLGNGLYARVTALTLYAGDLVATVDRSVYRWNGVDWSGLGSVPSTPASSSVWALAEYNGQLIVGGRFPSINGVSAANIAAWDGAAWHPLGPGLTGDTFAVVTALTVYGGQLVAGGHFAFA